MTKIELEHQISLCEKRDRGEITWQQVADEMFHKYNIMYGQDYYRKWWKKEKHNTPTVLNERIIEAQKERVKLADQRRELNALIREQARLEVLHDEITKAIKQAMKSKPLQVYQPIHEFKSSVREGVLLLSDWHKGLKAKNFWNCFDDGVFRTRVSYLTQKVLEYITENGVKVLHVMQLGDLVNGIIHVTSRINSTQDVATQTMEVAETLSEVLMHLASHVDTLYFYSVRGNHDRVTANYKDEIAKESFADIINWYLDARLSNVENVVFIDNFYDDEIISTDVCGFRVFGTHGHRDKTNDVVQNLTLMTGEKPDYVVMGHIHRNFEDEVHGVEIIVNSSLCGVDTYAKEIRKTSKPAQKLLIFEPKLGRIATFNIRLDIGC